MGTGGHGAGWATATLGMGDGHGGLASAPAEYPLLKETRKAR